jgi:hypothetical protein
MAKNPFTSRWPSARVGTIRRPRGSGELEEGATVRRLSVGLGAATLLAASFLAPAGAWAAANPGTTTEHNATETFHDQVPCVGPGQITITYNAVEHMTENATGFHATFTQTGTFSAVLDQGGTSSGRFTTWDGFNTDTSGQRANGTGTFSVTVKSGVGAGTHFHDVFHFTGPVDADGNPIFSLAKVAFDRASCH